MQPRIWLVSGLNHVSASPDHKDILKAQDLSVIIRAYVLVTSLTPLRAFIHSTITVWHPPKKKHFSVKVKHFISQFFHVSADSEYSNYLNSLNLIPVILYFRCSQCFQMLTFDIGFGTSIYPVVLKVHENFDFQGKDESNTQDQTLKELLFEDTFNFLLSNESSTTSFIEALQKIYGSTVSKDGTYHREDEQCLSLEEINSMITFVKELKSLGQFELLFPSAAPQIQTLLHDLYRMVDPMRQLGSVLTVHWLLSSLLEQFQSMTKEAQTNPSECDKVSPEPPFLQVKHPPFPQLLLIKLVLQAFHELHYKDTLSHIRQIFTSPQLELNPQFNPKIKEYYAEVPFDMVTVKIGAEPSNCQCQVHLDEKKGPSIANYPLGLGLNKVIVLVTDDSQPSPQVVSSYKITIYREDRPSLPLFDDYMMCGFVQDCGCRIRPEESCGLQPLSREYLSAISQTVFKTCEAGDTKGQWIVPCLSCSDNRTCDWREITWQPHGCQYAVPAKRELQRCMEGRRVCTLLRIPVSRK
uniref:Cadherin like and PC-esterase domain containing 1 n=1 Tax=Strigops habroptila TaxID=2489341 RepID=A0A672U7U9_STRHB